MKSWLAFSLVLFGVFYSCAATFGLGQSFSNMLQPCHKSCPTIRAPVCASDGVTKKSFHTECALEVENCSARTKYTKLYPGECDGVQAEESGLKVPSLEKSEPSIPFIGGSASDLPFVKGLAGSEFNFSFKSLMGPNGPLPIPFVKSQCWSQCNQVFFPVCADLDGVEQTFHCDCAVSILNCLLHKNYQVKHQGIC